MKKLIRVTINGEEYWDEEMKKTIFVPASGEPFSAIIENATTMIVGVDLAEGQDVTVVDGQVAETALNLEDMTVEQLREFAANKGIEIPGNLKKEETIREYIKEQLVDDVQ